MPSFELEFLKCTKMKDYLNKKPELIKEDSQEKRMNSLTYIQKIKKLYTSHLLRKNIYSKLCKFLLKSTTKISTYKLETLNLVL